MFISLNNILTGFARRHKIKNQIDKITAAESSEMIIRSITNTDIKVVWCKDGCVLLKTKTSVAANEVKLKERRIKEELQKNNIRISSIKYII